ncbi:MAG: hypothetical protein V3W44_02280 [Dehalococcoidales bacterium]
MVKHSNIERRVKVIAPFHRLSARCSDYAGQTGTLKAVRFRDVLPSCVVEFNGHLAGGFLPEELEVCNGEKGSG